VKRFFLAIATLVVAGALIAGVALWRRGTHDVVIPERHPPPAGDAAPAWSGDRPNVVLVIGCTVRRDQVSPYGGHPATTPFLSDVAANGVRFTDAISAAPWTKSAATTLLTGRPFREIGMFEVEPNSSTRRLAEQVTTLAEVFRNAGYFTIGATANPNLNRVFGFDQGFDRYHQSSALWRFGMQKLPGEVVVDLILPEIDHRSTPDGPVYVQAVFLDAHHPRNEEHVDLEPFGSDVPPEVVVYRAFLHRFDRAVQRLWSGLRERGFDDSNTILMVVSDHGEGLRLPPSQGYGHGMFLSPAVLQMTWLVRGRGVPAGKTVDGLASAVDVLPTLARLAGIDVPPEISGHDWTTQVRTGTRTDRSRAFSETDFHRADKSAIFGDHHACEVRYRTAIPETRCFDRDLDPFHSEPLPTPDLELVRELEAWRADQIAAAVAWPWTARAFPTREEREMLEQLGYVGDEQ